MKTKQTVCTALCALLVVWSCNEDNGETPSVASNELPENAIGFSVLQNIGDELPTKADITTDNLDKMTVYAYYTGTDDFNGVSSMPNLMSGVNVTKTSDTWTYSPLKYWPGDNQKVSFFAIAPEPVSENGIALKSSTGYPSFTITPPASPSAQKDIVVASATNQTKGDGTVALAFNHAMAKVIFSASYTGDIPINGYVIVKELQLKQVAKSNTLSLTSGSFAWDNVSYDASNLTDYTLSAANGDLVNDYRLTTTGTTISTDAGTLKLVPQTAPNPKVQLTAAMYDGTTTPKDRVLTADLASTAWDAGKQVTYSFEIDVEGEFITQWDYAYNSSSTVTSGATHTFTAPKDGNYKLEAWGAGGSVGYHNHGSGGPGGYSKGIIFLKKAQKIYVYVGGYTANSYGNSVDWNTFNGGGRNSSNSTEYTRRRSGIGGGATDFRLKSGTWDEAMSLNSRIMVAGGGGGAGNAHDNSGYLGVNGGAAGGLIGGEGLFKGSGSYKNTTGGTQISGGAKSVVTDAATPQNGSFGKGGGNLFHGGGGGGGYYGGGAGDLSFIGATSVPNIVAGGGGSSFISGMPGCKAINPSSTTEPREPDSDTTLDYNDTEFGPSPTWTDGVGIEFSDCSMIDGAGYEWNSGEKGASTTMPNPTTGSTMTGNTGNGYARITRLLE